jgi:hypothetical protein
MKFYLNGSEIECSPDEYKRLMDLGVINNGNSNADNKGMPKIQKYPGQQSLEDWLKEGQRGVVAVYGCQILDPVVYDQKFTCDTKTISNPGQTLMSNNGNISVLATDKCDADESTETSDTVANKITDNLSNNIPLPPIDMSTIIDLSTIRDGASYIVKQTDINKYVAVRMYNEEAYLSVVKLDAVRFVNEEAATNYANLASKTTGNNFKAVKFDYDW